MRECSISIKLKIKTEIKSSRLGIAIARNKYKKMSKEIVESGVKL